MLDLDHTTNRRHRRPATRWVAPAAVALGMTLAGLAVPSSGWAAPAATSVAEAEPAGVRIVGSRARIGHDGGVRVRIRSRCPATYQPYELNVAVRQSGAFGSTSRIRPPDVVVCDGAVHRSTVTVMPESGAFEPGPAEVSVFLGLFDTSAGSHDDKSISKVLDLRTCRSAPASTS